MFQGALASRLRQTKLDDLHNMVGANELASAINLPSQEAPNDLGDDVNNCGSTKTEISYSLDQDADCIENELEEFSRISRHHYSLKTNSCGKNGRNLNGNQ